MFQVIRFTCRISYWSRREPWPSMRYGGRCRLLTAATPSQITGSVSSFEDAWMRRVRVRAAWLLMLAALTTRPVCAAERTINSALLDLVPQRWVEIHRQQPHDAVNFVRQMHAGSAFDTRRGRIVVFGSD